MRASPMIFFVTALLLVSVCSAVSQTPFQQGSVVVKGISPETKKLGTYDVVSSGLPNVGKGQKVWLEAAVLYGPDYQHAYYDTITSESWSVTPPPGGTATVVHNDSVTYIIPDTTGQYLVSVDMTTNHGPVSASVTINSAYWVGVGGIVGSADIPECSFCHSEKSGDWLGTKHATKFTRSVDGIAGSHYVSSCLSCHTTGFDALPTAVNNGFDDRATQFGWTLPVVLQAGNWDSMKANYPEVAKLANIQCESCHGPGSLHVGETAGNQAVASFDAALCQQCHDNLPYQHQGAEWKYSLHAVSMAEGEEAEYMNRSSCSQCHTGQGFVDQVIKGQASAAPYTDPQPVGCIACHDPHKAGNPAQLRRASLADACTGCHMNRISSRGLHHSNQGPLLAGVDGPSFTGQSGIGDWTGWEVPGYHYENSSHSDMSDKCVTCHMAATPADTLYGLPAGTLVKNLGGHTFNVAWDHDTPADESDDIVNPNGCVDCHGIVTTEFVHQSQAQILALLDTLKALLPKDTTGTPRNHTYAGLTKNQKVAAYNYYFVTNDGSFGVHNHDYAKGLLEASIDQLKLGAGAADIVSVKDVPNDQGKQVQVVWNKFPAENFGIEPVLFYQLWRMDSAVNAPANIPVVKSVREMLTASGGSRQFRVSSAVWTFVGRVDAARLSMYSFIAPTIYDSTIAGGMATAVFYVSGHTANPTIVYSSMPDTGYSVDNLAPAPPAGLAAVSGIGTAMLQWNESEDADFNYFAVYRGTTENFVPSGPPLATTGGTSYTDADVVSGNLYYYKLAAVDFSGNQSGYSPEVALTVTLTGDEEGLPTTYALRQNHPNPFNPSTEIWYQLPEAAHVTISVYNTLGVLITTLVSQDENAGYHRVNWDGRDAAGQPVASGIYLYRMDAGSYNTVKKMVLMK